MFGKLKKRRSKRNNNHTYLSVAPSEDVDVTMEHAILFDHRCIDGDSTPSSANFEDNQNKDDGIPEVVTMDQLQSRRKKEE